MSKRFLAASAVGILALLAYPLLFTNPYYVHLAETILIYAILLYGLDIVVGYTGQVSLGHAGLFGSANDLAKVVQLYAWNGRYGGQQLIRAETMQEYTRCQFCPDNRRALGFDRPAANPAVNSARSASQLSYGHTGYTGTYFWVDPQYDLVVILLTNRVNPTRNNNKLTELSVRSSLLQLAIEAAR